MVSAVRNADDSEEDEDGDGYKAIKKRSSLGCSSIVEADGVAIDAFRNKAGVTPQEVIQSVMCPTPSAAGAQLARASYAHVWLLVISLLLLASMVPKW